MRVHLGPSRTRKGTSTDTTDRVKTTPIDLMKTTFPTWGSWYTEEEQRLIAERNADGRHPIG